MKYTKPQVLNIKTASSAIMGGHKRPNVSDNGGITTSSDNAYQSDE